MADAKIAEANLTPLGVRPGLLESPWTEEDGVIREYFFLNERSFEQKIKVWEFQNNPTYQAAQCPPCLCPLAALCFICSTASYDMNREMYHENLIEDMWRRRVAVTKDGIVYKQMRTQPLTLDPTNPCACCTCATGRFKETEQGASTQVFPFDRIQDVAFEAPAGGTRRIVKYCVCCPKEVGEMIEDVDDRVDISTAGGSGVELSIFGLQNGQNLRKTALAFKRGAELPPWEEGMKDSDVPWVFDALGSSGLGEPGAPAGIEMVRAGGVGGGGGGGSGQEVALLRSIDGRLGQLDKKLAQIIRIAGETVSGKTDDSPGSMSVSLLGGEAGTQDSCRAS